MLHHFRFLMVVVTLLVSPALIAQSAESLRSEINQIVKGKDATVGLAIMHSSGTDSVFMHADRSCLLQSVFKLHIALAVLDRVDQGQFTLDQEIVVSRDELLPGMWSPLRDEHPDGGRFPISDLIYYSVALSDNVGCDVLMRLIGGPPAVEAYFHKNGFRDISIGSYEEQMNSDPRALYLNQTTARSANEVLLAFYENDRALLSAESHDFLWKVMRDTQTGLNRLKGRLPEGTVVAHKTGSSGTNKDGRTAATNDIGIVFLPDGSYFLISVFVTDSDESDEVNEQIIADIARAAWDYFLTRNQH